MKGVIYLKGLSVRAIYPVISCGLFLINDYFFKKVRDNLVQIPESYSDSEINFISLFYVYIFTCIISLITVLLTKNSTLLEEFNSSLEVNAFTIHPNTSEELNLFWHFSFFLCGIFDVLGASFLFYFVMNRTISNFSDVFCFFQIIVLFLCSKLVIGYPFYNHHKVSFVLIIISFILIFSGSEIKRIKTEDFQILKEIQNFGFVFLSSIFFSLELSIEKHFLTNKGVSVYKILSSASAGGCVSCLFILKTFNGTSFERIFTLILKFENKFLILHYILFIVSRFVIFLLITYTNSYYSPLFTGLVDVILSLWLFIKKIILKETNANLLSIILESFGFLFMIFAILIYSEIIILDFCSFNKDTQPYVSERGQKEVKNAKSFLEYLEIGELLDDTSEA